MSFLKTISYMLSNELDRTLLSLLDSSPESFLDEKSYHKLVEILSAKNTRYNKSDALNSLLKLAPKQTTWPGALRYLMVMHKLIHDFGEESYPWISSEKMQHLQQFKTQDTLLKNFVHKAMVTYYYNYLQKLSYSYNDLRICFHFDDQVFDKLAEDNISPLHCVSKLQNTLRYLIQIFSLFEASIVEFKPCNLVKQVAYFCFVDCYHYYTYINQIVSSLLSQLLTFPPVEAIQVYEIYSEHIIITRKLRNYFHLIGSLTEFTLQTPDFYEFDTEYNRKIELHISSIRPQRSKTAKGLSKTMPLNNVSQCDESYISMKDVSQVITEAIAHTNANLSHNGNLFVPPVVMDKKRAGNTRIVHPGLRPAGLQLRGKTLDLDRSIDVQRTRGSVMTNPRVDASVQFDKSIGDGDLMQHIHSTYPLAANESFIRNANVGDNSIIHGVC